jgi:hypothetical protein
VSGCEIYSPSLNSTHIWRVGEWLSAPLIEHDGSHHNDACRQKLSCCNEMCLHIYELGSCLHSCKICIPPQSRRQGISREVALLLWTFRRLGLQTENSQTCDLPLCVMRSFCKKRTPMLVPWLIQSCFFSSAVCNLKWGHFWNMGHFGYTNPICVLISQLFCWSFMLFPGQFCIVKGGHLWYNGHFLSVSLYYRF